MKKWNMSRLIAMGILLTDACATAWVLCFCKMAIQLDFTGSLPYLSALIGAMQGATAVVLTAYFVKSKAENTKGGIVYDAALRESETSEGDL